MKIVRYRKKTISFPGDGAIGIDGQAQLLDGKVWNHADTMNEDIDVVFLLADDRTMDWYKKNKRPSGWKKVYLAWHTSTFELNNYEKLQEVMDADIDGFWVPGGENTEAFSLFNKPVISDLVPYNFLGTTEGNKTNKACLVIKNLNDVKVNYLTSLTILKKLNIPGVVTLNPAAGYASDTDKLISLVNKLNINLEVHTPFKDRKEYLKYISDCKIMINMDIRIGYNRNVVDAIETGMYCIGTYNPMQELFYKDLIVGSHEINKAVELCKDCLNKPVYKLNNYDIFNLSYMKQEFMKKL